MKTIIPVATILVASLLPAAVHAGGVPGCKPLPSYVRDAERTLAYCITTSAPIAACKTGDVDVQVFNNGERRLPQAGRGQQYYEGKARREPGDPAGTYRLVFLVTEGQRKPIIEHRYYSADHYTSFCAI